MLYRALAKLVRLVAQQDAPAANAALTEMRTLEDPAWPAIRLQRGAEAELSAAYDDPHQALERAYRLIALEEEAKSGMLHGLGCVVEIELCQGHAEAALRAALQLVSRLEGTRYRRTLNIARAALLQAWLATDSVSQARALALTGWPDAVVFHGHSAIWSDAVALLAALEGRARTCALLCGFAESRYTLFQLQRQNSELVVVRRATALARASIGDDEFDRLMSEGRQMREGEIGVLALAEKDYQLAEQTLGQGLTGSVAAR